MSRYCISFAGAGRVAGNLCREFHNSGFRILQIVSENKGNGESLSAGVSASWSSDLSFKAGNKVIIVAVPDHKLYDVLAMIKAPDDCIIAHTAGSYGLEVFPESVKHPAVFYPLQTFSKERKVTLKDVPVFIEAGKDDTISKLKDLAGAVGALPEISTIEQRRMLHIAAVFACNFTNFMFTSGKTITGRAGLSFDILVPLIRETVAKALDNGPEKSQTGPAARRDINTIEKHIDLLSFSPELQNLYKEVTKSITEYYKKNN
jgi:predicted short-subunit dehydrogenase-like oxidoreductase (DUF2520 family)